MALLATHIRKYRGAHILIINEFQTFISITFYKGKFYHIKHDAIKRGEYTNKEYLEVCDSIQKEAKKMVDLIRVEKSLLFKIKNIYVSITKRLSQRGEEISQEGTGPSQVPQR